MNDLHAYCLEIATRAKKASADLAVVTGEQKQAWLRACGKRLVECTSALLEANGRDMAGRTRLRPDRRRRRPPPPDARADPVHGPGPGRNRRAAGARRRDHFLVDPPQRPGGTEGPRAAGRGFLHLRVAAERDLRRSGDLRQERQRCHPARRQGSGPLQPRSPISWRLRPPRPDCRPTPYNWWPPPIAPPWANCSACPS